MFTFESATRNRIIGRLVGDQRRHIAVALKTSPAGDAYVLAVRDDGKEYVTWATGDDKLGGVFTYWGHYFPVQGDPSDAFDKASEDLARRTADKWQTA